MCGPVDELERQEPVLVLVLVLSIQDETQAAPYPNPSELVSVRGSQKERTELVLLLSVARRAFATPLVQLVHGALM